MEDVFSGCPHGYVKPYCPQCAGDELDAKIARRKAAHQERTELMDAKAALARQSDALDDAYAYIRQLERRQQQL